ncbi:tape measure protein [Klebsiella pneumoniae]|nr:tape measure protein [Klebsiella pneumoniae]
MASSQQMKVSVAVNMNGNLSSKSRQYANSVQQMSAKSKAALRAMRTSVISTSAAINSAGNRALMGVVGAGYAFNRTFISTARQAERFKLQMDALFKTEGSAKMMAWAKKNAKDTVLELDDVIGAMIRLKAYGQNPIQLLPTLEDEAAMRGWTSEQFNAVVDAIGKMFADSKISDEYNDVLTDKGMSLLPLLEQATGKSQADLTKMMGKGKLGVDAIRLAFKQMAVESKGASAQAMSGINGMISNASDNWSDFQRRLMDAGVTEELKAQLAPLLADYDKAEASGGIDKTAQSGAQAMIRIIRETSAAARGLYSTLSKVVALLDKGAQILGGWENTAKILAGVWAANKAARMGYKAFEVGRGAFNIGRGAWTIGKGGVKAGARGWNRLRGKRGQRVAGVSEAAGIQLPAIGDVQQVYVTNWPVAGLGEISGTDRKGRKGKRKRGAGRDRSAQVPIIPKKAPVKASPPVTAPVAPTKAPVKTTTPVTPSALKNLPTAAARGGAALARGAGRALPVAGVVLSVAELVTADSAEEAGSAIGSAAGAVIGGTLGSVVPVVGTAIGSVVGSYLGSWLGGMAGNWFDDRDKKSEAAKAAAADKSASQGGEIKVKVELADSLKMRSLQTASYGGLGLYTGGMPLW